MKRSDKIKFNICKPPPTVQFSDSTYTARSGYAEKLQEALKSDSCIQISKGDAYLLNQLRISAKKLGIKLVYGGLDGMLYIKPITPSADEKRLLLLLRESRTLNEIRSVSPPLQMDIQTVLAKMRADGVAHILKDRWVLTEKGMDLV